MKRVGHLFERITGWDNLLEAVHRASAGKRHRRETQEFCESLNMNLLRIQEQFAAESFRFGRFHQFVIHDPKRRTITAPCFEERVVHHAIINVCEPFFDRFLIDDTFACRHGRGRPPALARAMEFSRRYSHYLKMDVRKYFDSIHHSTLSKLLERRFKDERLLRLLRSIIDCHEASDGCGLPIGSLTSQHFANFYLGWLDRFVKEELRVEGFVRYMDDWLIWGSSRHELRERYDSVQSFLKEHLALSIKLPVIENTKRGISFLGCRVFSDYIILNRRSKHRFRSRLKELNSGLQQGTMDGAEFQQRVLATVAFTRAGGTRSWKYRRQCLESMTVDG
jgi:hypothetical protein